MWYNIYKVHLCLRVFVNIFASYRLETTAQFMNLSQVTTNIIDYFHLQTSLFDFGSEMISLEASLFPVNHHFESIQISGLWSFCISLHFLESLGFCPFCIQIESFSCFSESWSSSSSENWDFQLGQSESSKWE